MFAKRCDLVLRFAQDKLQGRTLKKSHNLTLLRERCRLWGIMASSIEQMLSYAAQKTEDMRKELAGNEALKRVILACHPKLSYAAYLLYESSKIDGQGEHTSTMFGLEPYLQKAVEKYTPTTEEYEIAKELHIAFTRIFPQKPGKPIREDTDGFIETDYNASEPALKIPPSEYSSEMVIDAREQLLVTHGGDSRLARPLEVHKMGRQIIEAIDPDRLLKLECLVSKAESFGWDKYIPPKTLEYFNRLPFYHSR